MLFSVLSTLLMLGILSVLIIVHEFGHFSVARFFGFQTPVFGIGLPFGPSWTVGEKWGTQFRIHALLLGGYVAIPELGDESSLAHEAYGVPLKPFQKFPIWQRALVAVAGVTMNVIFAYIVMIAMVAIVGVPGDKVYVDGLPDKPTIARDAGVLAGDRIESIDSVKVSSEQQVIDYLSKHKSTPVTLHIFRAPANLKGTPDAEAKAAPIDIQAKVSADGKVGMMLMRPTEKIDGSPLEVCGRAYSELSDLTMQMVSTLGHMAQSVMFGWLEHRPKGAPAGPGLGDLHGVLVVIKWGAALAQSDWTKLFTFTALISMDLAIVNLLPIPALDGGHLFFMTLEALRGKPMDERLQSELVKWGFLSLIALMAVIMVNDVRAWITGELEFKSFPKKTDRIKNGDESKNGTKPGPTSGGTSLPSASETAVSKSGPAAAPNPKPNPEGLGQTTAPVAAPDTPAPASKTAAPSTSTP